MDQKSVIERSFRGEPPPGVVFLQLGRQCLGQFFQVKQVMIVDAANAKARFLHQAVGVPGFDTALILGVPAHQSGRSRDQGPGHGAKRRPPRAEVREIKLAAEMAVVVIQIKHAGRSQQPLRMSEKLSSVDDMFEYGKRDNAIRRKFQRLNRVRRVDLHRQSLQAFAGPFCTGLIRLIPDHSDIGPVREHALPIATVAASVIEDRDGSGGMSVENLADDPAFGDVAHPVHGRVHARHSR